MPIRLNDIETKFRLDAESALKSLDKIATNVEKVDKSLKKLSDTTTKIGVGLGVFGAAITTALGFAIDAANEEATQLQQLRATIEGMGDSFEAQRPKVESFIDGLAKVTSFTDGELRPALNRAVLATGSLDEGMRAAELGAKIAAAGFGDLTGNAVLIARLFEGQVGAIGRLIPEFRDLEERLAAGETQATLAAEALDRLNKIAENAPTPDAFNQLNKAIGELQETIGAIAAKTITPFVVKLTEMIEKVEEFSSTLGGEVVIKMTLFAGLFASIASAILLFVGQILNAVSAIAGAGGFTAALALAQKAVKLLNTELTVTGGVSAFTTAIKGATTALKGMALFIVANLGPALIVVAGIIAGVSVVLDELSKRADEARDKLFQSDRLTQFTAEMGQLEATVKGLESGLISAAEAQKTFNKFGVANLEQAEARIEQLSRIIARLKDEKAAEEAKAGAVEKSNQATLDAAKFEKELNDRAAERLATIRLEIAEEERLAKAREGFIKAGALPAAEVPVSAAPDFTTLEGALGELDTGGPLVNFAQPGGLDLILEDVDLFAEKLGTVAERVQALAEIEGAGTITKAFEEANLQAEVFEATLLDLTASAINGFGDLVVNLGTDLATNFNEAGENAKRFFKQLITDLIRAIAKALILQSIISAIGGPGSAIGGRLLSLFQDPVADSLARFEGSRFVDLFFQGMFREFATARDRMDSALTENRDIKRSGGQSLTAIVNEATPETTVEFTDRFVEPRVRERARQRSSRGELTGAQIDRKILDHSLAIEDLRASQA